MAYASIEFADAFLANYPGGEGWGELTEDKKKNALMMADYAIDASGLYRFPDPIPEAVQVAASIEANSRINTDMQSARATREAGIKSASMGHASESYTDISASGVLWSQEALTLIRLYRLGSAPTVGGRCCR